MMCAIEMNNAVQQTSKKTAPSAQPWPACRSSIPSTRSTKSTPQTHPSHDRLKTKHLQFRRHSLGGGNVQTLPARPRRLVRRLRGREKTIDQMKPCARHPHPPQPEEAPRLLSTTARTPTMSPAARNAPSSAPTPPTTPAPPTTGSPPPRCTANSRPSAPGPCAADDVRGPLPHGPARLPAHQGRH